MNISSMFGRRPSLPPCKLFSEMAEEFGMGSQKLKQHVAHSALPFPKECLPRGKHNPVWLKPAEVRAWWKARQEEMN